MQDDEVESTGGATRIRMRYFPSVSAGSLSGSLGAASAFGASEDFASSFPPAAGVAVSAGAALSSVVGGHGPAG